MVHGPKEKRKGRGKRDGSAGGKEREEKGKGFSFKTPFKPFFQKFQNSLKQETMHSNHDAQSLIVSNFI
jgi:hypothetical protein